MNDDYEPVLLFRLKPNHECVCVFVYNTVSTLIKKILRISSWKSLRLSMRRKTRKSFFVIVVFFCLFVEHTCSFCKFVHNYNCCYNFTIDRLCVWLSKPFKELPKAKNLLYKYCINVFGKNSLHTFSVIKVLIVCIWNGKIVHVVTTTHM
jgi:hypothetical protein